MPDSCCAIGCMNKRIKGDKNLSFYRIPFGNTETSKNRRVLWLQALKRKNWPISMIDNARLCSKHFISGKKSDNPNSPDYVPSVFLYRQQSFSKKHQSIERFERSCKRTKKNTEDNLSQTKAENEQMSVNMDAVTSVDPFKLNQESQTDDINFAAELHSKVKTLSKNNVELKITIFKAITSSVSQYISFEKLKDDNSLLSFYTGLPNANLFLWYLSLFEDCVKPMKNIPMEDHLLLILMKIKLGFLNKDLSFRFGFSEPTVTRIYRSWLPIIAENVKFLIVWPEKHVLRRNLPTSFRKKFYNCVAIIDCMEILIERPFSLHARAQTWSNYKNNNTIKYLIGITPSGAVSFLSPGWGGRVSDKEITIKSGFLEKITHGDCVLADRGFTLVEEFATKGGILKLPKFTKGKKQMSSAEVDESRQIAHVRIHVERVIGRLRKFRILQNIIPLTQVDLLDDVMVTITSLVNINSSVVPPSS
ncbi:uncharacterized protein LOC124814720 [Hydra vulgaris]|uniref:uncharacterized protein LOC124814720 n=1 Tax=Hydra vulgaris TaxID=6087 RepID=UPI001F5F3366|nr:uncharacterized protein LOC124814720 [Hydra vulgaris]